MRPKQRQSLEPVSPDDSSELALQVSEGARRSATIVFEDGRSEKMLAGAVADVVKLAETLTKKQKKNEPPLAPIHCRAGCSHCCHMRVHVTAPESLVLALFIRESFSQAEIDDLRLRLVEADDITRGMTDEEHGKAGISCPLLLDDLCSAYDARPLECRGYVSMDVEACREASRDYRAWNVPLYFSQYSIFKNAQVGLLTALVGAGYGFEVLELTAALRIALSTTDVAERWLAGENVFHEAALPAGDPEKAALLPWTPTFKVPRA